MRRFWKGCGPDKVMTIIEKQRQNVLQSPLPTGCGYQEQTDNSSEKFSAFKSGSFSNTSITSMSYRQIHSQFESKEFVCGWGAALINIAVTFPLHKLIFRQMLHGISTGRAFNQLRREGLKHLYRGVLPPLCQKTISTSIMFGMYEQYSRMIKLHIPSVGPGPTLAAAASLAGFTEALLCPFERIQTLLQDKKYHEMYKNAVHCAKELRQFGVTEYYRGLSLILLRNGPSNVMFFGLRTKIKDLVPVTVESWYESLIVDFLSGAFIGAFISTITYPVNVLKAHQQTQVGVPFQSMNGTFLDVYNARGRKIRKLFKGVHVNYTRALVSWGIINAAYEILLKTFYS